MQHSKTPEERIAELEQLLYDQGKIASTSKQRAQRRERYLKRKQFEKRKAEFDAKQIDIFSNPNQSLG